MSDQKSALMGKPLWFPTPGDSSRQTPLKSEGPTISKRASVASTGIDDYPSSFVSPEMTHRSYVGAVEAKAVFSSPRMPRKAEVIRHGRLVAGEPPILVDGGSVGIMTEVKVAKILGQNLPDLRESCSSMLHEGINAETHRKMGELSRRSMLELAGVRQREHDPVFVNEIAQYQLEHPIPPNVLHKFPHYAEFPLLLSKMNYPTLEPNMANFKDVFHYRGHCEYMMDNVWLKNPTPGSASVREVYMHVPNFGRVQAMVNTHSDGQMYPLVTLPKMTPYDIIKVLDKQEEYRRRQFSYRIKQLVSRITCGAL